MRRLKTFLPRTVLGSNQPSHDTYSDITLTSTDIRKGAYKKYLGGGADQWEPRGAFQLFFLKEMGLRPSCKLLDVGCGPIRGGVHLIRYLDEGNYYGIDYNRDFMETACRIVEAEGLAAKKPKLELVDDFSLQHIGPVCDYSIVFSVLNHCNEDQRKRFFDNIQKAMIKGGKVYVTHAVWFDESYLRGVRIRLTHEFNRPEFDTTKWGWPEDESIFPVIELTVF